MTDITHGLQFSAAPSKPWARPSGNSPGHPPRLVAAAGRLRRHRGPSEDAAEQLPAFSYDSFELHPDVRDIGAAWIFCGVVAAVALVLVGNG